MHLSPSKGRILSKALMGLLALAPVARLCAQSNYSTPYAFTLIAGAGSPGTVDGTGNAAKFNQPYGIAIDSSGNLYVTDRSDQTVRKVTSGGVVTTIAGTAGLIGTTNATGTAALFNVPTGIAVGSGGDLYVCDTNNDTIRKITPAGVVSVFAGLAAEGGSLDGASGVGVLLAPQGVAVDSSGNVYVADTGNNSIRKVTSGGAITTLAGTAGTDTTDFVEGAPSTAGSTDGTGAGAEFNQPVGIAVDSSGNLYVADTGNDTIRKVTSGGVVTTIAGSPGQTGTADGTGSAARFKGPTGVAVDSNGNLYVADAGNSTIRKITPAGVVTTMAGLPANYAVVEGTGSAAIFDVPTGIAVDGNGNVFVTDKLGEVVQKGVVATVVTPPAVPVFTVQPLSVSVAGGPVVLNAAATGATSYQWYLNGTAISGETNPTTLIDDVSALNEGTYTCVATNSAGSVTSSAATVGLAVLRRRPPGQYIRSRRGGRRRRHHLRRVCHRADRDCRHAAGPDPRLRTGPRSVQRGWYAPRSPAAALQLGADGHRLQPSLGRQYRHLADGSRGQRVRLAERLEPRLGARSLPRYGHLHGSGLWRERRHGHRAHGSL